ncbi:MFS transporter [Plantactinospora sonchi]|uniref:MFS transporter n=1 Tax=Plantactinospora sonchi TaxID=1544735 RepID=A0ABU7S5T8_9ACTN
MLAPQLVNRTPPLLRQRTFARFWTAQTVSYLGDQVTMVALPLMAILILGASPAQLGYLAAAASLPYLLLGVHAGALVDRVEDRKRVLVAADLFRALLLLSVPAAFWMTGLTMVHLYAVAFLTGSLGVLFNVSASSLFPVLMPRTQFVEGNSLLRGSFSFSWVAGPGIGGFIVQAASAPIALVLDAISFLGSALLLGSIRPAEPARDHNRAKVRVIAGLSYLLTHPVLRPRVLSTTALNFCYTMYSTVLLLFAARELRLSPVMIGLAIGAGAVGALVGSVLTARVSRRIGIGPALILGSIVYPGVLLLIPAAPDSNQWIAAAIIAAAEFLSGMGLMLLDITGTSLQQAITPEHMLARITGASMALISGARPLAALVAGGLGTWLGLGNTISLAAALGILSTVILIASPIRTLRELPDTQP